MLTRWFIGRAQWAMRAAEGAAVRTMSLDPTLSPGAIATFDSCLPPAQSVARVANTCAVAAIQAYFHSSIWSGSPSRRRFAVNTRTCKGARLGRRRIGAAKSHHQPRSHNGENNAVHTAPSKSCRRHCGDCRQYRRAAAVRVYELDAKLLDADTSGAPRLSR